MPSDLLSSLRREATDVPASEIVEIIKYARQLDDVVPLWVGEGSLPTPQLICEAAIRALRDGETFYTHQRGIPELREALARYHEFLYARPFDPERFFVTGSGMQAIQIAVRMIVGEGDEVLLPSPAWPNLHAAVGIASATPVEVPVRFGSQGWTLDLDELFAACSEKTRAIFINTPSNPTGWTATHQELQAILDFARRKDIWIIADEIYTRFYYGKDHVNAPSFYEVMDENDKILFVNSFSKNWAMTGWRVGWISAPPALGDMIENLIQYSTSGVAAFMQRAAVAALDEGEAFLAEQLQRARNGREKLDAFFATESCIRSAPPMGSFYYFFGLQEEDDGAQLARLLAREAKVGLAPGFAFGQSGSAFMRLCFAANPDQIDLAIGRLKHWLAQGQSLDRDLDSVLVRV